MIEILHNTPLQLLYFLVVAIVLSGLLQAVVWLDSNAHPSLITAQKYLLSISTIAIIITILTGVYINAIVLQDTNANETVEHSKTQAKFFSGLDNDAARTVLDFHAAINSGDAVKAKGMLDQAVLIFEGGGVERSADEYAGHHLKADIAFLMEMKVTLIEHQVQVSDNMAVSMSRSKLLGKYKEKNIDINTMETITLRKSNDQWKIVHIHWSN